MPLIYSVPVSDAKSCLANECMVYENTSVVEKELGFTPMSKMNVKLMP